MITGYFTKVEIPEVRVGADVRATVAFEALNPGALYWATFLIVDSQGLPLLKMLDKARELGSEGGREKTYNLGKMPDKRNIGISFFLFAHDEAAYDWDWDEYNRWKMGFSTNLTYLGSAYRFISSGAAPPPTEDLKVLKYEILGESQGGSITFAPLALDAAGHYTKYTVVNLRAVVNPGFRFVKWRGEVDNELSTSLTNKVTMDENATVKAEFALAEVEKFYPLEIDIAPAGAGYVTTEPAPTDIANHFINGTVGKFAAGIRVLVTAHPGPGHEFYKWSDEIQGGVSYSNPEFVAGVMDEHRAVKAHFEESGAPEPPPEPPPEPGPGPGPEPEPTPTPSWLKPVLIAAVAALVLVPGKKGK